MQVNEFKTPSAELGSKETPIQGSCRELGHTTSLLQRGVLGSNETPFQGQCRRATERVAEWTCEFIRERGSLLEQWGVDGKVAKLIFAIHTHSWMKHECAKQVVVTTRGGRQGCKIGGVIFGAVFAQALKDLRCDLRRSGLIRSESTVLGETF